MADNHQELQLVVESVAAQASAWQQLRPQARAELLRAVQQRLLEHAEAWVADATKAKGVEGSWVGEEWVTGPCALSAGLNGLIHSLDALEQGKSPIDGFPVHQRADGQVVVDVFPANGWDRLLLSGFSAEVWQQPGVTASALREAVAVAYQPGRPVAEGVAVVLGAGNINAIAPLDALTKLITSNRVCVVKLNPVNGYQRRHLEAIFEPLAPYLRFVEGDAEVGRFLTTHPLVKELHLTGSGRTHDAVVFGAGAEGEARKARGEVLNPRAITSELGGVGPTLVVPGEWSDADLRFQAEHLVTQKLHNSGCNCVASQVLVLHAQWPQADALLAEIRRVIRELPPRRAWYPGHEGRLAPFLEAYPHAERVRDGVLLIDGLRADADEMCFREEAFGQVWGVVRLSASTAGDFVQKATRFANERLTGTLACQFLVDPRTERTVSRELDEAVARLAYGTVGINVWSGVGFLLPFATWGAFPGHTVSDVQSGIGVVHNALLFDKPQKTVLRGPFRPFPRTLLGGQVHLSPKPIWFVTHGQAHEAGRLMCRFEASRNPALIPPLFAAALRG